ncbi:PASTA domain-containing protein [Kocuria sp. UCD-OTCP]|uniref:PASTA domain-containing protein n=1 Tax=Kocuria sp. UCD-OTCP TaxID=1292021 RepID=UPI0009D9647C|nr:PASTA domain-containing protein [Kocuria sp. UCD-OTCP]
MKVETNMFLDFSKSTFAAIFASASLALGGCASADVDRASGAGHDSSAEAQRVPNVGGNTLFKAVTTIKEMDLSYKIEGDAYPGAGKANNSEWKVKDQNPDAGQEIGENSTVTLVVEKINSPSDKSSAKNGS